MGIHPRSFAGRAALLVCVALLSTNLACAATSIPAMQATALDGHSVTFPHDLNAAATVLILGFGRHSADNTTAWEKPTRQQLARTPDIRFYDMAMLAEIPRFARGLALHSIRNAVPDVLKPNFLPLLDHEDEWKQTAGFDPHDEEAAYVLLVDRRGNVRWSTHQPFSPTLFAQLTQAAQTLAAAPR